MNPQPSQMNESFIDVGIGDGAEVLNGRVLAKAVVEGVRGGCRACRARQAWR